jgi:hypothetical protein
MVPDEAEQAVIHQMGQLALDQGLGPRAIARWLNQAGLNLRGRPFTHSTIIRILRREDEREGRG